MRNGGKSLIRGDLFDEFAIKKKKKNKPQTKQNCKTFAFYMLVYTQVLKPGLLPQVLSSNSLSIITSIYSM